MNHREPTIRGTQSDTDDVVALSLRAWADVSDSIASVLGPEIYKRMYPGFSV